MSKHSCFPPLSLPSATENNSPPAPVRCRCAASCHSAGEVVDMHRDCSPWVSDGECFRNPAFMLQQCRASCEVFAKKHAGMLQVGGPSTGAEAQPY